jgi:cardiolipin synthase
VSGKFLPSALSALRIVATPLVVLAILAGNRWHALCLLAVAGATDFFDGFLARRYGWQSRLGAWLDAVADKALLVAVYIALALAGWAPAWLVYLVFGRDVIILFMALIGLALTPFRDFPPSIWGKISTNIQIVTALGLLLGVGWLRNPLLAACAVATGWSGIHYIFSGVKRLATLRQLKN